VSLPERAELLLFFEGVMEKIISAEEPDITASIDRTLDKRALLNNTNQVPKHLR